VVVMGGPSGEGTTDGGITLLGLGAGGGGGATDGGITLLGLGAGGGGGDGDITTGGGEVGCTGGAGGAGGGGVGAGVSVVVSKSCKGIFTVLLVDTPVALVYVTVTAVLGVFTDEVFPPAGSQASSILLPPSCWVTVGREFR
jgi:hypothetical protein